MNTNEINLLNKGEIIGHPSDTVFAFLGKLDVKNILKINILKNRNENQPVQILFSSIKQAETILDLNEFAINYLNNNAKEKTSYLVEIKKEFQDKYLTTEFQRTVLFRVPDNYIIELINEVGPLFATSANKHNGAPIVKNKDIENMFNIYVSQRKQKGNKDSKIISLLNNEIKIIRK